MSFIALLRRHYWVVKATGITIAAAFAGSAVMTTLSTRYLLDVEPGVPAPQLGDREPAKTTAKASAAGADHPSARAAQDVLARNPFCPTCVPAENSADAPVAVLADAPVAFVSMRLVATMESTDPSVSLATLYDPQRGITGIYGIGDVPQAGATIESIGGGVVTVSTAAGLALLRVGEEAAPPKPESKTQTSSARTSKQARASSSLPGAADSISCTGSTCVVERSLVESLMANPAQLATQAAVRPTSQGFQLSRVRSGSLPALLGLQSGDVLTEVNGQSVDSLEKALTLATRLRHATHLRVTLLRRGQTVRKEIQIS